MEKILELGEAIESHLVDHLGQEKLEEMHFDLSAFIKLELSRFNGAQEEQFSHEEVMMIATFDALVILSESLTTFFPIEDLVVKTKELKTTLGLEGFDKMNGLADLKEQYKQVMIPMVQMVAGSRKVS